MGKIGKILLYGTLGTIVIVAVLILAALYIEVVTVVLLMLGAIISAGLVIYDIVDGK